MNTTEITSLFDKWNAALQTGEPKNVAALYETNAILLPTVSNKVRHNHAEIEDYFVAFLAKGPVGKIDESNVRTFGDVAINSGVYTFTFKDGASVQARFTYVYRWNGQDWKIVEHHSSAMPEG
ncbi:MAG: SgcJ/EcaC family oxidoreductase [Coraliomargarita sp.]